MGYANYCQLLWSLGDSGLRMRETDMKLGWAEVGLSKNCSVLSVEPCSM